jgi:hypothetical protein
MSHKYMLIYRNPVSTERKQPSPSELQAMLAQWHQWKAANPDILDMGDALLPTGKALKGGVVTDGPTIESKELVTGYSIVQAKDYEAALLIAKACPILFTPGASIELRELAGF